MNKMYEKATSFDLFYNLMKHLMFSILHIILPLLFLYILFGEINDVVITIMLFWVFLAFIQYIIYIVKMFEYFVFVNLPYEFLKEVNSNKLKKSYTKQIKRRYPDLPQQEIYHRGIKLYKERKKIFHQNYPS